MADVESVKAGDTLRVPVKVIYQEGQRYPGGPLVCRVEMPSGREDSLSFTDVEAAEHIPAPKVFKRGDKVHSPPRWGYGPAGRLNGLVLGKDPTHNDMTLVHWGDQPWMGPAVWSTWVGGIDSVLTDQLEHDEAPE